MHIGAATPAFLEVYQAYPNLNAKQRAAQAFQDLAAQFGGEEKFSKRLLALFSRGFLKRHPYDGEGRFVPTLATFLEERRFEEKWAPDAPAKVPGSVDYPKLLPVEAAK